MNAANVIERVPIHTDAQGVVRVAGTRVTLETVVDAFETGATAEEIAQQYPTVPLVDVYSVITYYLRHKPDVDAYRVEREAAAGRVSEDVERRFPSTGVRERLLARRPEALDAMLLLAADEPHVDLVPTLGRQVHHPSLAFGELRLGKPSGESDLFEHITVTPPRELSSGAPQERRRASEQGRNGVDTPAPPLRSPGPCRVSSASST